MHPFDEMDEAYPALTKSDHAGWSLEGNIRAHYQRYANWLRAQDISAVAARREEVEMVFAVLGSPLPFMAPRMKTVRARSV